MKKLIALVLALVMVLGLVACAGSTEKPAATKPTAEEAAPEKTAEESAAPAEESAKPVNTDVAGYLPDFDLTKDYSGLKIGVTVYNYTEFITLMVSGMQAEADELGVELIILDAKTDAELQIGQVENLLAQQVDALIVAAVDSDAIVPAIGMAKDAGIPIIGVNMLFNTTEPYFYYGPDDVLAGELEMRNALEKIGGEGDICIIEGPIGQSAQIDRQQGCMNVLKEYPNVNVVADQTANWLREEAMSLVENWLQAFPNIKAIVAHNDEMALGAIQALKAAGREDVVVTGVDAIEDGCNAVLDGSLLGTVYQDAVLEGCSAFELALQVVTGQVTEPAINYIDMTWIDSSNAQDLIDKIY